MGGADNSVETPVHVSHQLQVEVVYSIWGQDHLGAPLHKAGPGEQRTSMIARSVTLPGVSFNRPA